MAVYTGEGTRLQYQDGTAWETVAAAVSISGPEWTTGSVDTTDLTSTTKTFRVSKLADNGEISFDCWYNKTDHADINTMTTSPVEKSWRLKLADADSTAEETWAFSGFLTKWALSGMEIEQNVKASGTIKLSTGISRT
jgi:hypothetical protein